MELQELITRGRFLFSGAPKRLELFKLISGKESTKDLALKTGRKHNSVLNDIKKMTDFGLITPKRDKNGNIVKKDGCIVYEKVPLIRHVSISYFQDTTKIVKKERKTIKKHTRRDRQSKLSVPSENEILDICKSGESQIYEFKAPRVEINKITKEIAAFLHTSNGGFIFYGIDDDGSIIGSDMRLQDFDQRIQNSIRNTIYPPPTIDVRSRNVLGFDVIVISIPPWDRKTLYQYTKDERYYIRKGTNVFALKPEEIMKLTNGECIV
ncbi:hypothetical protein DRO97_05275 [Archaeoglobales archaeon]|nr:MAG: hypothetical protein DRO97_05275 [Archaeoglobales archaeon]